LAKVKTQTQIQIQIQIPRDRAGHNIYKATYHTEATYRSILQREREKRERERKEKKEEKEELYTLLLSPSKLFHSLTHSLSYSLSLWVCFLLAPSYLLSLLVFLIFF
jgi:hypothetical protein